jgi:hypothetical protein
MMATGAALVAFSLLTPATSAPVTPSKAVVTIAEGRATVLDGARRWRVAPGLALTAGTIVETAADARLLRIEWPNGEYVNLGPDTRAMLVPPGFARRDRGAPVLYLLQGWAKYGSPAAADAQGMVTRLFEVAPFKGVIVARVDAQGGWLFVQTGMAPLVERQIRPSASHELPAGASYNRAESTAGAVAARASSGELRQVPQVFRDTLPLRYAQSASAAPQVEALPAPTYAELRPWLVAETAVRAGFTRRFRPLLSDRAFRRDLDAQLSQHTEWRPILHPPPPVAPTGSVPTR